MAFKLRLTPAAAATVLLAACGGGSNSSLAPVLNPSGGVAVDGYLSFAKIVCDTNENGIADVGEAAVYTLANGKFVFPEGCSNSIVASGGKNADTGLLFSGLLRAPAGSTVVSPLTSLMAAGLSQAQMNAALGLPAGTNLLTTDPAAMSGGNLVDPQLLKKTLAVQQLLQKITESLAGMAGASGSATVQPIFREVAAAFAGALSAGSRLIRSDNSVDETVVQALVKAAADRVSAAGPVLAEVKTAIRQINATALARLTSGALKVQADAILNAGNAASITAVTLVQQGSEAIASYVYQNKGQLAGAPAPETIAALGSTLTAQVTAGATTPSPSTSGTVLISFDEASPATSNMGAYAGALPSVEAGPTGGSGNALKILKPANPDTYGGVYFDIAAIPFTATRKTITARVFSTRAGAVISLKAEAADASSVEVVGTATGAANSWQTVTWVLTGIDPAKTYSRLAITPDATVVASGKTYYLDDITLAPAATVAPPPTGFTTLTFDEATPPAFAGFNGAEGSSIAAGPSGGTGNALKVLRTGGEVWAGAEISGLTLNVSATLNTVSARVHSPAAGKRVVLKLETSAGAATAELDARETVVAGWQTLTWVIPAGDIGPVRSKIVFLPNLGTLGTGEVFYFDDVKLEAAAVTPPPPPTPTNYLAIVGDAISLTNGSTSTPYSMTAFQSAGGISVSWPMASTLALSLNLSEVGTFVLAPGQTVNAAVSIAETGGGLGEVKAYVENVSVTKTSSGLVIAVPNPASSMVYGVSGDGSKKAVVDFSNSVSNITNTLSLVAATTNSFLVGDVANYAINQLSNDFTGINSLRGKYAVTIVIDGLPLKKADGSALPAVSVVVPTSLSSTGAVLTSRPVTGVGLTGYITLTN